MRLNRSSFTYNTHSCKEGEPLTHTIYSQGPHLTRPSALNNLDPNGAVQSIKEAIMQCWETSKSCTQLTLRHGLCAVRYLSTIYQEYAKSQQDNMGCCQHPNSLFQVANLALRTNNSREKGGGWRKSIKRVKQYCCIERFFGQWTYLLQILTGI